MKVDFIKCKEAEYICKAATASLMGNMVKVRKMALTALVFHRLHARAAHDVSERKRAEVRAMKRTARKAKADGVTCIFTKPRIKLLQSEADEARKELAQIGERLFQALDLWQTAGAAFEDLCNFCNRDPVQVRKELLESESTDESFSKLATVHNLDYKNPRDTGWLEDSVDAPLTHALKEYLFYTMLHTEEGRKASHEAMEKFFPEIMENAYTEVTGKDGIRHLYDKDGVEIAVLDEDNDL